MKFLQRLALTLALVLAPTVCRAAEFGSTPASEPVPAVDATQAIADHIYHLLLPSKPSEAKQKATRRTADHYAPIVRAASERHRLDPAVVAAMFKIESGYNPHAVSCVGARGLGQVMPFWWEARRGYPFSRWREPAINADLSCRILAFELRQVTKRFPKAGADARMEMALVAYNMGGSAVSRGIYRSDYSRTIMRHARRPHVRAAGGKHDRMPGVPTL